MLQRLTNLIDSGADIEFSVNGTMYTILPWTDGGITVGQQGAENDKVFDSIDALLNGFEIDGVPLLALLDSICIVFAG